MPHAQHGDTAFSQRPPIATHYSCYPNACAFQSPINEQARSDSWQRSREQLSALALHLHLPFCAHACYHCQRLKISTKDHGRSQPYLQHLVQEMALTSRQVDPRQHIEQLHLGGATPNFLSHNELRELMQNLRQHFTLLDDDSGDYSIEIDPREADWSTMGLLRELGFNRVLIGVHELTPEVQDAINRPLGLREVRTIIEAARTLQYRSVGVELMYGLPQQTTEHLNSTLSKILALQPDRICLTPYQHSPDQHPNQRNIQAAQLPEIGQQTEMRQAAFERLEVFGYRHIGLGHFALPDDELSTAQEDGLLRYTLTGYSTRRACDVIGLGPSSISYAQGFYSQNSGDIHYYQQRLQNAQLAHTHGWLRSNDDHLRAYLIEQLLCYQELKLEVIEQRFHISLFEYLGASGPVLQSLIDNGQVSLDNHRLRLHNASRETMLGLCQLFDSYASSKATT